MNDATAHRWIDVGPGKRIHCEVEGNAQGGVAGKRQDVVFLPGNTCSIGDFAPLRDAIVRKGYRFIGIDPPGREPTVWPDEPLDFVRDLPPLMERVLEELEVGPHIMIGHSMGGMLGLQLAMRSQIRGRELRGCGLVLIEGFVSLAVHYRVVARGSDRPVRMSPEIEAAFHSLRRANRAWEESHPIFHRTFWESQQSHDARPWIAELRLPLLFLLGDLGQPMPRLNDMDAWRKHLGMEGVKDLTVRTIADAGHWLMLDDPPAVEAAVCDFLSRVFV